MSDDPLVVSVAFGINAKRYATVTVTHLYDGGKREQTTVFAGDDLDRAKEVVSVWTAKIGADGKDAAK